MKKNFLNTASQVAIPVFTLSSQALFALKSPEWGLVVSLVAQPFWLYSTWKSYKEAGQIGILINTVFFTIITAGGVINYWLTK